MTTASAPTSPNPDLLPGPDKTQRELLQDWARVPLRMPRTSRELLQLLALYDPKLGLESLLDRVDLTSVQPADIFQLVHGRAPESIAVAVPGENYSARQHFGAALLSTEFQNSIMRMLLASYPEKLREIFIHVPKCAGTDLILNVASTRLGVPQMLGLDGWISKEKFLTALGNFAKAVPFYDSLFIYGHIELSEYVGLAGVRPGDRIFTIIRDPFDLMLSQANYAVSRLIQDPVGHDPDTRELLKYLDLKRLPEKPTPKFLKDLAVKSLLDNRISQPNRICHYLGNNKAARYEIAMNNLVTYDLEITVASSYGRWLQDRWNLRAGSQHNRSISFLTKREASRLFAEQVAPFIDEDQKFFDVVSWVLCKSGKSSVTGLEVAREVGESLLTSFPAFAASRNRSKDSLAASTNLVAAHGAVSVDRYLQPIADEFVSRKARVDDSIAIDFRVKGNSREYGLTGWASPEQNFTWTAAAEVTLTLPRPEVMADYILRIVATPFTAPETLPMQRLTLAVNGQVVGTGSAKEIVVFEADLPWSLLTLHDNVEIVMSFPNAAMPRQVNGRLDERLLAFAVQKLSLLRSGLTAEMTSLEQSIAPVLAEASAPAERDLMMLFESIGENCEFGLAQRLCGAEPLGLLRFASTPFRKLLAALEGDLTGLGDAQWLEVEVSATGREYMVLDTRYGLRFHAWVEVGEKSRSEVHARESRRVPFLVRKLRETLVEGEKIVVFHGMDPLTQAEAQRLCDAIGRYGPATLLWVELADDAHRALTVERVGTRLLKGYIDRFAPGEDAHNFSLPSWIAICREAMRLTQLEQPALAA